MLFWHRVLQGGMNRTKTVPDSSHSELKDLNRAWLRYILVGGMNGRLFPSATNPIQFSILNSPARLVLEIYLA